MLVRQNLNFNVPRILEKFLHVHRRVVEGSARFGFGHGHCIDQRRFGMHHAHAAPAAAASGLNDDRVTNGFGDASNLGCVVG